MFQSQQHCGSAAVISGSAYTQQRGKAHNPVSIHSVIRCKLFNSERKRKVLLGFQTDQRSTGGL